MNSQQFSTLAELERFIRNNFGKKIICFGAADCYDKLSAFLSFETSYFIDNDANKWGTYFREKPVLAPNSIVEEDKKNILIVVSSSYYSEIASQLETMGFAEEHYINGYNLLQLLLQTADIRYEVGKRAAKPPEVAVTKYLGESFIDHETTSFAGDNVILPNATLIHAQIGRFTYISKSTTVEHATIGAFCSIGPECLIGPGMHPPRGFISTHPAFYAVENMGTLETFVDAQGFTEHWPVVIGNDVWIGARVIIMGGVTIGDGAIIGAGAIVTRSVEPYSVMGGVPARQVRKRYSEQEIERLLTFRWWDKSISWIRDNAHLFGKEADFMKLLEQQ